MNDDNKDTENEMLWAAQDLRTITSNQTEVTISRRVILSPINSEPKWDYLITFGDLMNRGKWRWECAQADTLERAVEIAHAHAAMQGNERNRELAALRESAAKLGATLIENAALRESAAKLGATLIENAVLRESASKLGATLVEVGA